MPHCHLTVKMTVRNKSTNKILLMKFCLESRMGSGFVEPKLIELGEGSKLVEEKSLKISYFADHI